MSILNVNNFGGGAAVADNAPAIRAALAAANPTGDTIFFPDKATYNIGSTVQITKAVLFQGADIALTVLKNTGPFYAFKAACHGFSFDTIASDGNLLGAFDPINGTDNFVNGVSMTNMTFHTRSWTQAADGVSEWAAIAWNKKFTNATFRNFNAIECEAWTFFYGYSWDTVSITDMTFQNVQNPANLQSEGRVFKWFGVGAEPPTPSPWPEGAPNIGIAQQCQKLYVARIIIKNFRGMGFEHQDGSDSDLYEDITILDPIAFGTNVNDNLNEFGASWVMARATNAIYRRVYIDYSNIGAPVDRERVGVELGGRNFLFTDSYIHGDSPVVVDGAGAMSIACNGTNDSGTISHVMLINAPPPGGSNLNANVLITDVGPNATLSWDINRTPLGFNAPGAAPTPAPAPTPTPEPTPMPDSPSGTYINSVGPTLILGGVTCGIAAGARVSINGAPDTHTSGVIGVLSYAGQFYQQQATQWWKCSDAAPKIGSQYVQVAADPRPVTPPPPAAPTLTNTINIYSDGSVVVTKPSN